LGKQVKKLAIASLLILAISQPSFFTILKNEEGRVYVNIMIKPSIFVLLISPRNFLGKQCDARKLVMITLISHLLGPSVRMKCEV
jgi:hypothetical protein